MGWNVITAKKLPQNSHMPHCEYGTIKWINYNTCLLATYQTTPFYELVWNTPFYYFQIFLFPRMACVWGWKQACKVRGISLKVMWRVNKVIQTVFILLFISYANFGMQMHFIIMLTSFLYVVMAYQNDWFASLCMIHYNETLSHIWTCWYFEPKMLLLCSGTGNLVFTSGGS